MVNMIFSWKKSRDNRRGARKDAILEGNFDLELKIPNHFLCPISLDLMKDPVTLSTGITYDRENIERWIEAGHQTCPVTDETLTSFEQIPNHSLRKMIQDWCVENKSFGVERIPTPRIPISQYQVLDMCLRIEDASGKKDGNKCQELLDKIKRLAKESERNKRCIVENGVGYVLSSSFESFASDSREKHEDLLKSMLSILTWMFPLGSEGQSKIGSPKSLTCMASFLNGEDLASKQHAVLVLKDLLSNDSNQIYANALNRIEFVPESLFKILQVPTNPSTTKAALVVIYCMLSSSATNTKIISRFLEMGLVHIIIEMIADSEKNISERALGVLDCVCNWEEGRKVACKNALTMPVLVKKILRISDLGTEFCVSILWKLCKGEDEHPVLEAMEVGGFQKLLVILQVGCGENTKEKITELLKLMNLFRDRIDCLEGSTGFKYVKRPF